MTSLINNQNIVDYIYNNNVHLSNIINIIIDDNTCTQSLMNQITTALSYIDSNNNIAMIVPNLFLNHINAIESRYLLITQYNIGKIVSVKINNTLTESILFFNNITNSIKQVYFYELSISEEMMSERIISTHDYSFIEKNNYCFVFQNDLEYPNLDKKRRTSEDEVRDTKVQRIDDDYKISHISRIALDIIIKEYSNMSYIISESKFILLQDIEKYLKNKDTHTLSYVSKKAVDIIFMDYIETHFHIKSLEYETGFNILDMKNSVNINNIIKAINLYLDEDEKKVVPIKKNSRKYNNNNNNYNKRTRFENIEM